LNPGPKPTPNTVADVLPQMAASMPEATAIYFPTSRRDADGQVEYEQLSYRDLDRRSSRIAAGLHAVGIARGQRAALMVQPSPDLFALTFGMFKAGVVPVMIDPGLGLSGLKSGMARAQPDAFIGIPKAHLARVALGWGRETITTTVSVGGWGLGGHTLAALEAQGTERLAAGVEIGETDPDEIAAILFTSGSTGPAKGVVYRHRTFLAQVEALRDMFGIEPGDIDLPTFPLFALFDPALGMTTVIPDMDSRKPAQVDPRAILEPIARFGITTMFGSPALLDTVGRYGEAHGVELPSLRRVMAAGAPLPADTMRRWHGMLSPDADVYPPYGATESLPVACMPCREILAQTWTQTQAGAGVCVGRPVASIRVQIIEISDEPIDRWDPSLVLPDGEIGEITVRGPMVTEAYYNDPDKTAAAKIPDGDGLWHRMGDVGWRDEHGRIWFCGRKAHRVIPPADAKPMFSVACEKIIDTHPAVYRSALVGPSGHGPTLCVELESTADTRWASVEADLRAMIAAEPKLAAIEHVLPYTKRGGFPVDIRHNAKIGRERLRVWAEGKLR